MKMDEYYNAIRALPEAYGRELARLPPELAPHVQEVRIRSGAPVCFTLRGALTPCTKYLPQAKVCAKTDRNAVKECFLSLCRYSVYAYEEELKEGYLTVDGGNRVGVAGVRGPYGFSTVTSLNLRVSRWITCSLPPGVLQALRDLTGGILVAGAPGSGKTTVLRSMIEYMGHTGRNFSVVDERSEIFGRCAAEAQSALCDVYTQCAKAEAILMAIRTMNPRVILCDELGSTQDAAALEEGIASGVAFVASVHCDSWEGLSQKPQLVRLLRTGAFRTILLLEGAAHPGTICRVGRWP